MPNVIDYVRGENIDPVTGKNIRRTTTGSVPGDIADMLLPVSSGDPGSFAPGFASNLIQNYDFFDDATNPSPSPVPQAARPISGQIPARETGRGGDARLDNKSRAGAISNFDDWARAVAAGSTLASAGGPFKAAIAQATGSADYTDDYGNYAVTDPEGWAAAVAEGTATYPNDPNLARTYAANKMARGSQQGGGSEDTSPANSITDTGSAKAAMGTPLENELGLTPDAISAEDMQAITTASAPRGGQRERNARTRADTQARARASGEANFRGAAGANQGLGSGANTEAGRSGGASDSGRSPGESGFGSSKGEKMATGGYVTNMPSSVSARRPAPAPKQAQNATANHPPAGRMQMKKERIYRPLPDAMMNIPQSAKDYASGGFVPKAGYENGGAVVQETETPDAASDMQARFNPSPEQIADDGVVDNQPINTDEGEFVLNRESAQIAGPEVLNALNDPDMMLQLSNLIEDALALQGPAGGGMGGAPAAPSPMAGPGAAMNGMGGAAQGQMPQQRTSALQPSTYRKGGYVTRKGSIGNVRC